MTRQKTVENEHDDFPKFLRLGRVNYLDLETFEIWVRDL